MRLSDFRIRTRLAVTYGFFGAIGTATAVMAWRLGGGSLFLGCALAALAGATFSAVMVTRSITAPIKGSAAVARRLEGGDLTLDLRGSTGDEFNEERQAVKGLIET